MAEESEVVIETVGYNPRFPQQNQTKHCWAAFVEYNRCLAKADETDNEELKETVCNRYNRTLHSLCPAEWIEQWNEANEAGTFAGQEYFKREFKKSHHH